LIVQDGMEMTCLSNDLKRTAKSQSLFSVKLFSYSWLHFTSFSERWT